mmetsp:Transcript_46245/g.121263  ORF Transcript_46245/g.121263 Transcript_46245/m.121263 type:complete len:231 (-) Transcript_46245:331-1023(-)
MAAKTSRPRPPIHRVQGEPSGPPALRHQLLHYCSPLSTYPPTGSQHANGKVCSCIPANHFELNTWPVACPATSSASTSEGGHSWAWGAHGRLLSQQWLCTIEGLEDLGELLSFRLVRQQEHQLGKNGPRGRVAEELSKLRKVRKRGDFATLVATREGAEVTDGIRQPMLLRSLGERSHHGLVACDELVAVARNRCRRRRTSHRDRTAERRKVLWLCLIRARQRWRNGDAP